MNSRTSILPVSVAAVAVALALLAVAAPAAAKKVTAPDRAASVLASLADPAGQKPADTVEELLALGDEAVPAATAHLSRERASTDDQRRAVLRAIKADVPDKKGRFRAPGRQKADEIRRDDSFDWLAALLALAEAGEPPAGFGDVLSDVAAIRVLAASGSVSAAQIILDTGFDEVGMVYRDECGRRLRAMDPYSLPALIRSSLDTSKSRTLRGYANYQLDRMDRQHPDKALRAAAGDEDLVVAILGAYGESKLRTSVGEVLAHVDHDSPRVRAAAREAWMGFITGRAPKEAPKRKLILPGGKQSDEEEPLWLTYRELAEVEIRRVYEQVLGEKPGRRAKLTEMTETLFAHYDQVRADAAAKAYADAADKAAAGDLAAATAAFDRLLAQNPDHPRRAEMAPVYLDHARALEKAGSWVEAAAAYSKVHGLAPDAPAASDALASHYRAVGKALEAEGKDGSAAYQHAAEVDPDAEVEAGQGGGRWMLYAGLGGGGAALILLIMGLALRRRQ